MYISLRNGILTTQEVIKPGDSILCDSRNHKDDEPIYHIDICSKVENGWIFGESEPSVGMNPNYTHKIA